MKRRMGGAMFLAGALLWSVSAHAQDEGQAPAAEGEPGEAGAEGTAPPELPPGFAWQNEGVGQLGERAKIDVPQDYTFLSGPETSKLLRAMGNLSDGDELGLIATKDLRWFAVFFFDDVGYVKDDEKEELDADEMSKSLKENLEHGNEMRQEQGLEALHFDGWAIPPRFNDSTKQLEWASRLSSDSGVSVNYNTRVLGRKGVMRVILACDPEILDASLPEYRSAMKGFDFTDGERYAEWVKGDKLAEYGLIALVAGGAGAVAAKTGLLTAIIVFAKKGFKLILVGLVAIGAFLKRLFTGRREDEHYPPPPSASE